LLDRIIEVMVAVDGEREAWDVMPIHLRDHLPEDDEPGFDGEQEGASLHHFLELLEVIGVAHLRKQSIICMAIEVLWRNWMVLS
jgi:hypothetical protein